MESRLRGSAGARVRVARDVARLGLEALALSLELELVLGSRACADALGQRARICLVHVAANDLAGAGVHVTRHDGDALRFIDGEALPVIDRQLSCGALLVAEQGNDLWRDAVHEVFRRGTRGEHEHQNQRDRTRHERERITMSFAPFRGVSRRANRARQALSAATTFSTASFASPNSIFVFGL